MYTVPAWFYVRAGGQLPPQNLGLAPQMWHETLFYELRASVYKCKKERSEAFKIRQNAFSPPRTLLGELRRSPDPLIGWGWDTPFPYPTPLAPRFSRLRNSAPRFWRGTLPPKLSPNIFSLEPLLGHCADDCWCCSVVVNDDGYILYIAQELYFLTLIELFFARIASCCLFNGRHWLM